MSSVDGNDVKTEGDTCTRRFSGLARVFSPEALTTLSQSHVMVVGIGGVGSWAVEALARSGVGALTLVDFDVIVESNINRQIHALSATLGMSKNEAMKARIAQINPACQVSTIEDFVKPTNWQGLIEVANVDVVIDACDEFCAKEVMAAWSQKTNKPFITVGAAGGKKLAHQVLVADLAQVTHDPILAKLRYQLRRHHGAPKADEGKMNIQCIYSQEPIQKPSTDCAVAGGPGSLGCYGYGSFISVTATFGFCAAGWVVQQLAEQVRPGLK